MRAEQLFWKDIMKIQYYYQMKIPGGNQKQSSIQQFYTMEIRFTCFIEQLESTNIIFPGLAMHIAQMDLILNAKMKLLLGLQRDMKTME